MGVGLQIGLLVWACKKNMGKQNGKINMSFFIVASIGGLRYLEQVVSVYWYCILVK